MTYEDADIFAFISNKSKPTSAPDKATISEKDAGSGENTGLKESPENKVKNPEEDVFEEAFEPGIPPAFEEFPVPSPESGFSEKEELPFETFEEYDPGISRTAPALVEAFGIVTTGIEPLEITPSGATITGYISSARRSEIRLGTYVVVPYEDGEKLFARVGKLQYRQEFAVDDATEIHSRRMLNSRANPVNEADYKFLACLDPLCILYRKKAEGSLTRRMADRIPRPNTPLLPVTDRLEVQTGLNIPEKGIFLGHLSVGGELVKTHSEPETVAY